MPSSCLVWRHKWTFAQWRCHSCMRLWNKLYSHCQVLKEPTLRRREKIGCKVATDLWCCPARTSLKIFSFLEWGTIQIWIYHAKDAQLFRDGKHWGPEWLPGSNENGDETKKGNERFKRSIEPGESEGQTGRRKSGKGGISWSEKLILCCSCWNQNPH